MTNPRAARLRDRLSGLAFGGDYNPEQWPKRVWDEDVRLMRQANVNIVTLGVFSWSVLEPSEGQYRFEWLDDVIGRAHAAGILVDLATPNAAPPPWMAHRYPETLLVDRNGTRVQIGSRGHFCPSSPVYRDRSLKIARALADRYGQHPALALWHVGNEYHAHCFCDLCDVGFRGWLQNKYQDLDELNDRWTTAFWSQRYDDWEQVHLPKPVRGNVNPTRELDFARFVSDVTLDAFIQERDLFHELTPDIPVTTNFFQSVDLNDYHRWGAELDVVSFDSYPDPARPDATMNAALQYDLMRSIGGGQPWLTLEQAANAVSQWKRNYVKADGGVRLDAYRMVARGSDAVMFFQWRASRGGQEKFHSGMLPHGGTETRSWKAVEALGNELPGAAAVVGSTIDADVAIVWDWDNWWAVEGCAHPTNDFSYKEALHRHYAPLFERNIAVDVITLSVDLSRYRVIVIPNQYLITDAQRTALRAFVEAGGQVVISYFSGIVNEDDRVIENGYPGGLRDIIGAHVLEFSPMLPSATVMLGSGPSQSLLSADFTAEASDWQDDLVTEGADVVLRYAEGPLAGVPAVTDHALGEGRALYVGTQLPAEAMGALMDVVLERAGVTAPHAAPAGIEVTERRSATRRYLFFINGCHRRAAIELDHGGVDLLTGTPWRQGDELTLDPSAVVVLASDR